MEALTTEHRNDLIVHSDRTKQRLRTVHLWLATLTSDGTRKEYKRTLDRVAKHLGFADGAECADQLLQLDKTAARQIVSKIKADAISGAFSASGKPLAASTTNRLLTVIRSLYRYANDDGIIDYSVSVKGVPSQPYRDTRGPGLDGVAAMLKAATDQKPRKAARDVAVVKLLFALGLRRGELAKLNIGSLDLEADTIEIVGKGRTEPVKLTLPQNAKAALCEWLKHRGTEDPSEPLFVTMKRGGKANRITGSAIEDLIRTLGNKVGIQARPHGLRHTAVTEALRAVNGDVTKVQAFSRHKSVQTVQLYNDARHDHGGKVAAVVDGLLAVEN